MSLSLGGVAFPLVDPSYFTSELDKTWENKDLEINTNCTKSATIKQSRKFNIERYINHPIKPI